MRIYAVADVHARPARIDQIRSNIRAYAPDVLVIAGDISNYRRPGAVLREFDRLPLPVLAVRGNTDLKRMESRFNAYANIVHLHLQRVEIQAINFVGLSGTIPVPFRSRIGFRQKSLMQAAGALLDRESILIAHPPPYGILDKVIGRFHAGSTAVSGLLRAAKPRLMLCGHIHEAYGHAWLGETQVVNCNMGGNRQGAIIDIEKTGRPEIRLLSGN
jgi:Icc-related predicted phosphoesterase